MSEEQLTALLAKVKEDVGLREKLKGAADLDAAVAIARDAGFDVSKADWLRYQAKKILELSDEELERVTGGLVAGFCSKLNTTCNDPDTHFNGHKCDTGINCGCYYSY
jgi:predicted ribosomally synthesized peptide with nif11-like leader